MLLLHIMITIASAETCCEIWCICDGNVLILTHDILQERCGAETSITCGTLTCRPPKFEDVIRGPVQRCDTTMEKNREIFYSWVFLILLYL